MLAVNTLATLRPSSAFPCLHNSHAKCRHPAPGRFADAHHYRSSITRSSRAALPVPQLFRRCSKSPRDFPSPALLLCRVGQAGESAGGGAIWAEMKITCTADMPLRCLEGTSPVQVFFIMTLPIIMSFILLHYHYICI